MSRLFHALVITLAISAGIPGCAHSPIPIPNTKQYEQAFAACMASQGISDVTGDGAKVLQILTTPGLTQQEITRRIEALGIAAAGDAVRHTVDCAITSFMAEHPIGPTDKPTPAQAAVRVYQARYPDPHAAPGAVK